MIARMLMTLALALVPAVAHAQTAVRLHRTARVEPGRPLLLADLAAVEGPMRDALAPIVVVPDPDAEPRDPAGWFEIDLPRVRAALEAHLGDKAGMVAISGSACSVRVTLAAAAAPGASPKAPPAPEAPDATSVIALPTVRGAVARELSRILGAEPSSLRLAFDAADDAFLDLSIDGRILEIAPTGSSDRMPISIAVYGPGSEMHRRTVAVGVEVRRPVAVASRAVERGRELAPEDLLTEDRWLTPGDPAISPDDALGALARRRIKPGEVMDRQAVEPPLAVRRGERVWVRVVTGRWVVRREATAMEGGREGDEIAFASIADSRERLRAVVTGRGQAAVWSPGTAIATAPTDE